MKVSWPLPLVLCLIGLACQSQTERPETVGDHIDTLAGLARQFSQAYIEGDARSMAALYTDAAVLFPNNAEYIRGKEAIERYWTLPEGRRITHHKLISIEVSGAMASDFGHYEISGENGGVAWGPSYGKYVVVWKQGKDGRWRMHLDMWNSRPQPDAL